jgi:hypothetical protein
LAYAGDVTEWVEPAAKALPWGGEYGASCDSWTLSMIAPRHNRILLLRPTSMNTLWSELSTTRNPIASGEAHWLACSRLEPPIRQTDPALESTKQRIAQPNISGSVHCAFHIFF